MISNKTTLLSHFLALAITLGIATGPAMADDETGLAKQANSLIDNKLKAFVYDWYARFDNGPSFDGLAPNLPEKEVKFAYPQATITSVDELKKQFEAAWPNTKASSHEIEEIFVYAKPAADLYEVVTPHTYLIERTNGSFGEIDIVSRMIVQTGQKTTADPEGENPKVVDYLVKFEGLSDADVSERIAANRIGDINDNQAKSFVHQWFAHTDARDADAIVNMASAGKLNVDLLGTKISSRAELKAYLEANSAAQSWATHQPHNIMVRHTDEGFAVRFIVHFEGNIKGMGDMTLTNVTNWLLVEEDGTLKLRDYSLEIL